MRAAPQWAEAPPDTVDLDDRRFFPGVVTTPRAWSNGKSWHFG
jgi:hypothetical protein